MANKVIEWLKKNWLLGTILVVVNFVAGMPSGQTLFDRGMAYLNIDYGFGIIQYVIIFGLGVFVQSMLRGRK